MTAFELCPVTTLSHSTGSDGSLSTIYTYGKQHDFVDTTTR